MSSLWAVAFAYVLAARLAYSLAEDLISGGTMRGWWNLQRMWLIRRTTSYFFALIDTVYKQLGISETSFALTAKVADGEVQQRRYEDEKIEFGSSSVIYVIIATLALLNLLSVGYGIKRAMFSGGSEAFMAQMVICGLIVVVSLPVYEALLFRSDKGSVPSSVLFKSIVITSLAVFIPIF